MSVSVIPGDCLATLVTLPAGTFQTCVTSPPYYGLRDYGVAGQIGLEDSPGAFVARLVDVFREVRRVLRDDGTVFLNLGDSYSGGVSGRNDMDDASLARRAAAYGTGRGEGAGPREKAKPRPVPAGWKPKDLLGIPWMVAKALRAPYYTGRIRDVADRIWLAAMIDAEGCLFIHRRKAGQANGNGYFRQNDSFGPGLEVANTSLAIVERCQQITGLGSICSQTPDTNNRRKQTIYRWNLRTTECRDVVREVYPHLVGKRQQARILIGCPSSGEKATAAHAALILLHRSGLSDVDFPEPASMFEPGWYLRSAIVWSKLNPMPESVRDRPTSSYEMVFLLTKQARYFYDAEAIREEGAGRLDVGRMDYPGRQGPSGWTHEPKTEADGRNARNVWTIATQPYSGAHFATMPPDLAERCIKAGSSEKGQCPHCGAPWARQVDVESRPNWQGGEGQKHDGKHYRPNPGGWVGNDARPRIDRGWSPSCDCPPHTPTPQHVLDPFGGAGTTGLVADRLGRHATLCELNPEYARLARERITADAPLLAGVA